MKLSRRNLIRRESGFYKYVSSCEICRLFIKFMFYLRTQIKMYNLDEKMLIIGKHKFLTHGDEFVDFNQEEINFLDKYDKRKILKCFCIKEEYVFEETSNIEEILKLLSKAYVEDKKCIDEMLEYYKT